MRKKKIFTSNKARFSWRTICHNIFLIHIFNYTRKWKAKVAQLCLTFCDPMDYTVHVILQASILEWVTFPFSSRSSQPRN